MRDKVKDLKWEKVYPHENGEQALSRLRVQYGNMRVYYPPMSFMGNSGFIELYPDRYPSLVLKLEGPMFILEEIYKNKS